MEFAPPTTAIPNRNTYLNYPIVCCCRSAAVSEVESFAPATIAIPAEITGENPDWNPP